MPSDELRRSVLDALHGSRDQFRSAVAATIEEVRAFLATHETSEEDQIEGEQMALGRFAAGRVDPARFTSLLTQTLTVDESATAQIERAFEALQGVVKQVEGLGAVRVEAGRSLRDAVAAALAQIGRVFGAAHVVAAARAGTYDEAVHGGMLQSLPFAHWTKAERRIAPPLLVEVAGADLHAASLAEFLDGTMKMVLLVDGPSAPAPLARLLTPSTFVQQGAAAMDLTSLLAHDGPGILAFLPEGAARFVHDPAAGASPSQRLQVQHVPDTRPRRIPGGPSAGQQAEDLALLAQWCMAPGASAQAGEASTNSTAGAKPVDKLAAWLLRQADLKGVD